MSQKIRAEGLRPFFQAFENASATTDVDALMRLFAPAILVAGPSGSQIVKAADLMMAIPKRKQMFAAAGCQSTTLVGVHEQRLDDRYTLARTEWRWQFTPNGRVPADLTLPSTFLVEQSNDEPRIVVYLMHHDIGAVLKEHRLIP
jgi:hypothetical protein